MKLPFTSRVRDTAEYIYQGNKDPQQWGDVKFPFTITFNVGAFNGTPVTIEARNEEEAKESFLAWLEEKEWQTVLVSHKGEEMHPFHFRTKGVMGFEISQGSW